MSGLTVAEVRRLDPYAFLAVLGKRVIHPGGRASTDRLLEWAALKPGERVLDVGCGVATTAVRLARERDVDAAGLSAKVSVEEADILNLPYADASYDCVVAEAVTMFVDRQRAAKELARVCKPGGRVLATEFFWREPPTEDARQMFLGEVCPGLRFDSVAEWVDIYGGAGLADIRTDTGPFAMMTPRGFLADEGWHAPAVMLRAMTRFAYLRKMTWLMPRMSRAVPYLGYIVVCATKPTERTAVEVQ
jgi:SAM-dependent methyltransferase